VTVLQWLLAAYVLIGCLYWLVSLVLAIRIVRVVPLLKRLRPAEPATWPRLTLIIPACNEADTLASALEARRHDGYPDLEIVLVDDRSTDGTAEIIDRAAAADARVRAVHIRELPAGWLGKVHALQRGVEAATGEWLLFSDADVHWGPGTLCRCMAYTLQRGFDYLALFPELWRSTFLLDVLLASFVRVLCVAGRLWAVEDPHSSAAAGAGAFSLVRREALERAGGFAWLRLEIVDDVGLAQMLKQSGARPGIVNGRGLVGLHWYRTMAALARGMERSVFVGRGRFSMLRMLIFGLAVYALDAAPFVGLIPSSVPHLALAGVVGSVLAIVAQAVPWCWIGGRPVPALLPPVAAVLWAGVQIRATVRALRRGGLEWRGTFYGAKQLRQGARLRFP
jgi:glycosyltransferase involved in cell wall biosynthesis